VPVQTVIDPTLFSFDEAEYLGVLLRKIYEIRTLDGEEDELLGDLIEAIDSHSPIKFYDDDAD